MWVAQQDSSTLTAPVTNPRIDVLVIDNAAGTVSWVAGSEGASPAVPAVGLDKTPLWAVYLRVSTTAIDRFGYNTGVNSYILRDMRPGKYRPVPPFRFPGEISPSSFGANQDNYNPTGLAAATTLRLTATGASRNITGIAGGSLSRHLRLVNVGSQNIVLKDADTGSTAANRFAFPSGDVTILPNGEVPLDYDNTSQRWRLATIPAASGSGISNTEFDAKGDLLAGSANDAFDNLAVGSNGQVLTADSTQTLGVKWATPSGGAMTLIADTTLGADASSVTFSSISGTYKHLLLLAQAASDQAGVVGIFLRFNGDSGSNYDAEFNQTSAGSNAPTQQLAQAQARCGVISGTNNAGSAGAIRIDIPNYAGTSWNKYFVFQSSFRNVASNADFGTEAGGGDWKSTAAITSLTLLVTSGNLKTNSRFTLWGLS